MRAEATTAVALAVIVLVLSFPGAQVGAEGANSSVRQKLLSGEPLHFKSDQREDDRTVLAEWIAEAARRSVKIELENAIVVGVLNLKYATLSEEVSFVGCIFKESVDFSYSTFKRNLVFSGSTFVQGANFRNSTLEHDATFDGGKFLAREADFRDLHVRGVFTARQARFGDGVRAIFDRARFEKSTFFVGSRFAGEVRFVSAQIGGQARFEGVRFESTNQPVSFDGAKIADSANFGDDRGHQLPATTFAGETRFIEVQIGGQANFDGVQFRSVSFDAAKINGDAFFRDSTFNEGASFINVRFGRQAHFHRVGFRSTTKHANFDGAKFGSIAFFLRTSFDGDANFRAASFGGQAAFQGAVFKQRANFNGARFDSLALFRPERKLGLAATTFGGEVDFIGARLGATAEFTESRFASVDRVVVFDGARIDGSVYFEQASFAGEVSFIRVHITGDARFSDAQFTAAARRVSFERTNIDGNAVFERGFFAGETQFIGTHVGRQGVFRGATFKQNVSFNSAKVDAGVFFNQDVGQKLSAAVFEGGVDFVAAQIGTAAEFQGVRFNGRNRRVNFDGAQIAGAALFQDARFADGLSFAGAEIIGRTVFDRAEFLEGSRPSFSGTKFRQEASFVTARFQNGADFSTARFNGGARFGGVTFGERADFTASHFTGLAHFSSDNDVPGATFDGSALFNHSRFDRDALFEDTIFKGPASFREMSLRVVYFSRSGYVNGQEQFQSSVDLRGSTYDRIRLSWQSLLRRRDGASRLIEYDRQPYTQLEKVLRDMGEDTKADDVYLERRRVEREENWRRREYGVWMSSELYALLANYGVRPYRLIGIPAALLVFGTLVFSRPGAVRRESGNAEDGVVNVGAIGERLDANSRLSVWEALRLSVRLLLPVEVPLAACWEPSDKRFVLLKFSDVATVLKLAGWILIPLGIAALSGLLRRVAS